MKRSLNTVFILMVIVLMFTGCQQPILDAGEIKFKQPGKYHLSNFSFTKQVEYLEVIEYKRHHHYLPLRAKKFAKNVDGRFPAVVEQYYPKRKYSLSETQKRSLQMLRHEMFIGGDHLGRDCSSSMMASFCTRIVQYIDKDRKSHIVSSKKALKALLGDIDTTAEVQLWLTLSGRRPAYSCKKMDDTFRVRWNYIQYSDIAGLCYHNTYFRMLNSKGEMGKAFDSKRDGGSCLEMKKRVGDERENL